jgi:hypothetical protein
VGLFSNKTKADKPSKATRPRVFLSKEDRKEVNRLRPLEKQIGLGTAAYALAAITAITAKSTAGFGGNSDSPVWRYPLGAAFCLLFAVLIWKTNRWLAGIGAILAVYGSQWGTLILFAFPVLAFFVWLNIRIFKDQRKRMDEKAAAGEYGIDPRDVPRGRKKIDEKATEDGIGRVLPPASKRYTPPKKRKK